MTKVIDAMERVITDCIDGMDLIKEKLLERRDTNTSIIINKSIHKLMLITNLLDEVLDHLETLQGMGDRND